LIFCLVLRAAAAEHDDEAAKKREKVHHRAEVDTDTKAAVEAVRFVLAY
jgi:hypothetical protein